MKVGIVSPYPIKKSTHVNDGGVIAYTKNLAQGLSQWSDVTVFCEKNHNSLSSYSDSQVRIIRCWQKGPFYPFNIWFKCFRSKFDIFHVQHEFFLYGGFLSAIIFPLLLLFLNLYAPVIVTIHGVVSKQNVNKLSGSNRPLNRIKLLILKTNLRLIDLFSSKLIVHDKFIKDVLIEEYTIKGYKIEVIPHGIEEVNPIDNESAKEKLGISASKVILFFGYLTQRKGLEILLETFEKMVNEIRDTILIVGAGENPRLKHDKEYQKYYQRMKLKAKSGQDIHFIGFIPEDKLSIYISAADIIIFPYSVALAASGALNLALAFNRLVLCSDIMPFRDLIKIQTLLFRTDDVEDLHKKLLNLLKLPPKDVESLKFTLRKLKNEYSWSNMSRKTFDVYCTIAE